MIQNVINDVFNLTQSFPIKKNNNCLNKCYGNGKCIKNKCECDDGFYGIDCSCDFKCYNGGICSSSTCKCRDN